MTKHQKRLVGRKTKADDFLVQTLVECFENGFTDLAACEAANIVYTSLTNICAADPAIADKVNAAKFKYRQEVKLRVISRTKLAQQYIDDVLAGKVRSRKTVTKTVEDGAIAEIVETEELVLPDRWILERYLPVDVKPEETTEEIVVRVDFGDDSTTSR